MYDWLLDALRDSSQTVTASRRLARELVAEFGEQQRAGGKLAWPSPAVYSWQDWLAQLLASADTRESMPTRINGHQSRVLWERCLRREISDPLLNVPMLVRQSRESWARLREFRVPLEECQRAAQGRDQRIFAQAAANYESILEREHWVDEAGLAHRVTELVIDQRVKLPSRVTLAGFDRLLPQVAALLEALSAAGTLIEYPAAQPPAADGELHSFDNIDAEMRVAGAWARQGLEQDPDQRIAVIVTNLEQDAARYTRLLREGLAPGWQYAGERHSAAVNVSYGRKLSAYPTCAIGLLLLRWLHGDLSSREVSLLLRSPTIGSQGVGGRSRLELHLRQLPERRWTPEMLLHELGDHDETVDASDWLVRLASLNTLRSELPRRDSPSSWATLIDKALHLFGWPGDDTLDSASFQLVNRWRELLNDLARLELVSPHLTVAEALSRLTTMASETVFQPEADGALVQLLGPLEAAGMEFDRVWISGLSSASWPPPGRPLALVSRTLQRSHGMPDADPQDTLDYARRVLARLTSSARHLLCSYSLTDGDAQQTATGLLSDFVQVGAGELVDPGWHAVTLVDKAEPSIVKSDPVPPVSDDEQVSGGATTLQRQLEEPFSAFVYGRLGVRPLQTIMHGLPASLRGSLVHDALYRLYGELPTQSALDAWDKQELERRIRLAVDKAFRRHERHADLVLKALLELEKRRDFDLLHGVVDLDRERDPFAIAAVEQSLQVSIEGIRLRVRIDRIDRLENGEIVILDYKTGMRRQFLGRGGEPKDVQLLVYAFAMDEPVSDLGLVNIDSRSIDISGAGKTFTPDIDWASELERWRAQVEAAARDMCRGDIALYGLHNKQAARPLALLSRVRELRHDA